jgi:rifampicin phosphotransferase
VEHIAELADLASRALEETGGKALGLGRLVAAGFKVPKGFCVLASAYREALESRYGELRLAIAGADPKVPSSLDVASQKARAIVMSVALPEAVEAEFRAAYRGLCAGGGSAVAVRSSATAEDLPELSFAGQQDSFLGVESEDEAVLALRRCWASLWNARAIGYRARAEGSGRAFGLGAAKAALPEMAVVVQLMVPARSAGVLFTADPLAGSRQCCVIEAVRGLGEALVSGKATPERFVAAGGKLVEGPSPGSGILSEAEALELASIGKEVEAAFGKPQDIEWAIDGSGVSLLQSRPITSLYPLPEDGRPCRLLFSFGSWQGFLDPFTPLGAEMMLGAVVGVGRLLGQRLEARGMTAFREAGDRLWVEIGGLLRYSAGKAFARIFLGSVDPAAAALLEDLGARGLLPPVEGRISARAVLALLGFAPKVMRRVARNMLGPARGRAILARKLEGLQRSLEAEFERARSPAEMVATARRCSSGAIAGIFPEILGGMVSSQVPFQNLMGSAKGIPGMREDLLELTRGLPHNVTTEMDLELWALAGTIGSDPQALAACRAAGPEGFARAILEKSLPASAAQPIAAFLERYGFRGPGEIDLGKARWRDDPAPLARVLLSYLGMERGEGDPASLFASGAKGAEAAAARIAESFRKARGPVAAAIASFLARRVRELSGLRESPKFGIIKVLSVIRTAMLSVGEGLVRSGSIEEADDVFFLRLDEIEAGLAEGAAQLSGRVAAARAVYDRESRRRRIPRLLAGDGSAYFDPPEAPSEDGGLSLRGCPVSPGTVVGWARIVFDPSEVSLEPGDILVCPGTDPAWTPLFMAAAGLVTVVGGEMTHGSVVAREYGIPAVVGVAAATERIPEGARILVDGSRGLVRIEEP